MGRPLNKRYLGEPTPDGQEIKVQFFNGSTSVDGWIVKQLGSKRFRCTDGTATADCALVDKLAAALTAGEMSISVKDDAGVVTQVTKISGRKLSTAGTTTGWNFSDSVVDAKVEMEEAGSGDPVIHTAGDFVVGTDYTITVPGDTDFVGEQDADDDLTGTPFTALVPGTGTGTATVVAPPADTFGT